MLLIMTDEELIARRNVLIGKLEFLKEEERADELKLDAMYVKWRAMEKGSKERSDLHKRIFKKRREISRHPRVREMNLINSEIIEIDLMLCPRSTETMGNLYINDGELDFVDIVLNNIHGCKL